MTKKINYAAAVDELGRLKARIADLETREEELAAQLRALGPGAYEGALFRATVGKDGEAVKRDAQAMRDKLWAEGYYAFVRAHEEVVPRQGSVRVVARIGAVVGRAA